MYHFPAVCLINIGNIRDAPSSINKYQPDFGYIHKGSYNLYFVLQMPKCDICQKTARN